MAMTQDMRSLAIEIRAAGPPRPDGSDDAVGDGRWVEHRGGAVRLCGPVEGRKEGGQ
jgi:hypothetical protein